MPKYPLPPPVPPDDHEPNPIYDIHVTPHDQPTPDPEPAPQPVPEPTPQPTPDPAPVPPPVGPADPLPPAALPLTKDVPFRATGDLTLDQWKLVFQQMNSPIDDVDACWHACKGLTALALAQAVKETSLASDSGSQQHRNPLGLMIKGSSPSQLQTFATYHAAFSEYYQRATDPNASYYMPRELSLEGRIVTYVGGPLCWSSKGKTCANGETWVPNGSKTSGSINLYIAQTLDRLNQYRGVTPAPVPTPTGTITYGKVPAPTINIRLISDSQNHAWDNLGQRSIRGLVYHRMVGTLSGTDGWFRTLWQPDGEKGGGQLGLTDFGLDAQTGEIMQWNDYLGLAHSGVSANRAGWASGPWNNVPGDGMLFFNKFGINSINRNLVSIEISGNYDSPISAVGQKAIVALSAYLADQAHCAWTDYPIYQASGLTFTYLHNEFQNEKPCPGQVVEGLVNQIIAETKDLLKKYQTS